MINRRFAQLSVLATLAMGVSIALASNNDASAGAETGDAAAYNQGKGVYASKLACTGCTAAGKRLDAALARELLGNKGNLGLSVDDSQALTVYLQRRFKL
jgi:hypothetical protein